MRPLAYTFPYFLVFLAAFVWSVGLEQRLVRRAMQASASGDAPADRGSLYVVVVLQGIGFFAAFSLAWLRAGWTHFSDPRVAFWIGIAVMLAGSYLRRRCFRELGQFFTGEVRVRSGQRVVTTGPYRWIRHPGYTAGILLALGTAIALGSWLGALIATAMTMIGYAYRVAVEERALLDGLGDEYRAYMRRTKRFIPFIA